MFGVSAQTAVEEVHERIAALEHWREQALDSAATHRDEATKCDARAAEYARMAAEYAALLPG